MGTYYDTVCNRVNFFDNAQIRKIAAKLLPAKYFDEYFTAESANANYLRGMVEDYVFEFEISFPDLLELSK